MEKEIIKIFEEIRDTLRVIARNTERISNPLSTLDGKQVSENLKNREFKFPTD